MTPRPLPPLESGWGEGRVGGYPEELRSAVAAYAEAGVVEVIIPDYNHTAATRRATLIRLRDEVLSG